MAEGSSSSIDDTYQEKRGEIEKVHLFTSDLFGRDEPVVLVASGGAITHFCLPSQSAHSSAHQIECKKTFSKTSPVISGLPLYHKRGGRPA